MEAEQSVADNAQIGDGFQPTELEEAVFAEVLFKDEVRENNGIEQFLNDKIHGTGQNGIIENMIIG